MNAAIFTDSIAKADTVYGCGRRERLARETDLLPDVVTQTTFADFATALGCVEVIFSTWGMFPLDDRHRAAMPKLRAVFYAAGSVKRFAQPLLENDIRVFSAWAANAVPVAEFTLAQILLSNKGYFRDTRACRTPAGRRNPPPRLNGNFGTTVALLGAGMIGRRVIELLRPFDLHVLVWDPFLSSADARELGVEKIAGLEEAFERGAVVSNHLANVPETHDLITANLFRRMPCNATFLNTGRGATVREPDLVAVLRERPDLTALLDVTRPEPPADDSPLYELPNVQLSSHIAGSLGTEVVRMADYMIEEFQRWRTGEPTRYEVTPDMLATMA